MEHLDTITMEKKFQKINTLCELRALCERYFLCFYAVPVGNFSF